MFFTVCVDGFWLLGGDCGAVPQVDAFVAKLIELGSERALRQNKYQKKNLD